MKVSYGTGLSFYYHRVQEIRDLKMKSKGINAFLVGALWYFVLTISARYRG